MGRAVANIDAAAPAFRGEVLSDAECVVCRKLLSEASVRTRKTACGHIFCSECISRWLSHNALCPLCNHDLTLEGGTVYVRDEQHSNDQFGVGEMLHTILGGINISASSIRPISRRGGTRPVETPDVLTDTVSKVTAIMDRAKADVIAEVARAVARLERR